MGQVWNSQDTTWRRFEVHINNLRRILKFWKFALLICFPIPRCWKFLMIVGQNKKTLDQHFVLCYYFVFFFKVLALCSDNAKWSNHQWRRISQKELSIIFHCNILRNLLKCLQKILIYTQGVCELILIFRWVRNKSNNRAFHINRSTNGGISLHLVQKIILFDCINIICLMRGKDIKMRGPKNRDQHYKLLVFCEAVVERSGLYIQI